MEAQEHDATDPRWQGLHRLGGGAAFGIALLLLGELVVYSLSPRPETAMGHFALFQRSGILGLLTLDLLGMIAYLLFIPTTLSLYVALRRTSEAYAAVATVLFFVGIAAFFATNTAFPVLALGEQYAAATTDAERAMYIAAGHAMFTLFNENAFLVSYVLVSAAWVMTSFVMLHSPLFTPVTALSGMVAGVAGIIAVVLEHLPVDAVSIALPFYFLAIVALLFWVLLLWRRLLRLGHPVPADLCN